MDQEEKSTSKSYQCFIIEHKGNDELIVTENTSDGKVVFYVVFAKMILLNVVIIYYSRSIGAAIGSGLFVFICFCIVLSQILDKGQKRKHVFDKSNDLISFKGNRLIRLSAISHIEVYVFMGDEDSFESYRVSMVSEEFNRKFRMYAAMDEYDMMVLARELSTFMGVPLVMDISAEVQKLKT